MTAALYIIRASSAVAPQVPRNLPSLLELNRHVSLAFQALGRGAGRSVGEIVLTAGGAAPSGWLVCDGSALLRAGFPALFALIGTRYGAGDGSTTFNIPTQAQCVPPAVAPTAPQVVTGGSVDPAAPFVPPAAGDNVTGGNSGANVIGGRVPRDPNEREE